MIAAVHISPWVTVPVAFVLASFLAWYWMLQGRPEVARTRRRIRRLSVAVMLISLPNFVRGLSFLDAEVHQVAYLVSWSMSLLLVLIVFVTACLDAMWTLRMDRRRLDTEMSKAAGDLLERERSEPDEDDET